MLQRWMITLVVSAVGCVLFSACGEKKFSPDEPLPTVYTPSVYITSQNRYLFAVDPSTGTQKWEYNLQGVTKATPLVVGSQYLIVATTEFLHKFDANTGKLLRRYSNPEFFGIESSPVTDGKIIYVAANPSAGGAAISALDPNSDNVLWTVSYPNTITASLALHQDRLIVALTNGDVHCLSKNNGTPLWTPNAAIPLTPGNPLYSSPVISPPYVLVGSPDKNLYALLLTTGANAWTYTTENIINSSPIVYGGNVIFGCNDNYVYCVDSISKNIRWKFKTSDRVISSAAAYRNTVFIGGYDNFVYAINVLNGDLKWKYKTNGLFKASVLNVDGDLYAASFDKYLYKLDTAGNLKWKFNVNGPIEGSPVLFDYNNSKTYYPSITGMYQF